MDVQLQTKELEKQYNNWGKKNKERNNKNIVFSSLFFFFFKKNEIQMGFFLDPQIKLKQIQFRTHWIKEHVLVS